MINASRIDPVQMELPSEEECRQNETEELKHLLKGTCCEGCMRAKEAEFPEAGADP